MDQQDTTELYGEISTRAEAFAAEHGYAFSSAKEKVLRELTRMFQRFGDFYCPCQAENAAHTVCVCEEVRHGYVDDVGRCHCNLFVLRRPDGAARAAADRTGSLA